MSGELTHILTDQSPLPQSHTTVIDVYLLAEVTELGVLLPLGVPGADPIPWLIIAAKLGFWAIVCCAVLVGTTAAK